MCLPYGRDSLASPSSHLSDGSHPFYPVSANVFGDKYTCQFLQHRQPMTTRYSGHFKPQSTGLYSRKPSYLFSPEQSVIKKRHSLTRETSLSTLIDRVFSAHKAGCSNATIARIVNSELAINGKTTFRCNPESFTFSQFIKEAMQVERVYGNLPISDNKLANQLESAKLAATVKTTYSMLPKPPVRDQRHSLSNDASLKGLIKRVFTARRARLSNAAVMSIINTELAKNGIPALRSAPELFSSSKFITAMVQIEKASGNMPLTDKRLTSQLMHNEYLKLPDVPGDIEEKQAAELRDSAKLPKVTGSIPPSGRGIDNLPSVPKTIPGTDAGLTHENNHSHLEAK